MLKFFGLMSAAGPTLIHIQWHNMTKLGLYLKGMGLLASLVGIGYLYVDAIMKKPPKHPQE